MGSQNATVDRRIGEIAARQHGVVTRDQVFAAGLSARAIQKRLDKGWLIGVFPGVYRVGHMAPSDRATFVAAVYACGEGAALSGGAAAHLLGFTKGQAPEPEVTAPKKRVIEGITTRRSREIEATKYHNIPVTTPARTLVDLAGLVSAEQLARAVHEAGIRHNTTPDEVEATLAKRPRTRGAGTLRAILRGDTHVTLSRLESRFLRLLRDHDVPLPRTNKRAGGRFVDCRWPEHALTVELDSYRYHASRHAWEQDRKRERQAYARGDQFRRYTWEDVTQNSRPILRELRAVLASV